MIFKLQRPIYSNRETPTIFCYTKGHKFVADIPTTQKQMKRIFGDELKESNL